MKHSILIIALIILSIMSCNQEEPIAFGEVNLDDIVSQLAEDDLFHNYLSILHKYEVRQTILNEYKDLSEADLNNMDSKQVMSIVETMYGFNSSEELDNYFMEIANVQAKINEKFLEGRGLNESETTYILTSTLKSSILSSVNGRLDRCLERAGSNYGERLANCWEASPQEQGVCFSWAQFRYRWALTACYAFN